MKVRFQNYLVGFSVLSLVSSSCNALSFAEKVGTFSVSIVSENKHTFKKKIKPTISVISGTKSLLNLASKMVIHYGISAIFGLLTVAVADRVTDSLFGVKCTDIIAGFLKKQ